MVCFLLYLNVKNNQRINELTTTKNFAKIQVPIINKNTIYKGYIKYKGLQKTSTSNRITTPVERKW